MAYINELLSINDNLSSTMLPKMPVAHYITQCVLYSRTKTTPVMLRITLSQFNPIIISSVKIISWLKKKKKITLPVSAMKDHS